MALYFINQQTSLRRPRPAWLAVHHHGVPTRPDHHVTGLQGEGGVRSEDVQDCRICDRKHQGMVRLGGLGCTKKHQKTTRISPAKWRESMINCWNQLIVEEMWKKHCHCTVHLEVFRIRLLLRGKTPTSFPKIEEPLNEWDILQSIWENYNISLTWIVRPFGDDFPKINHDFQWGRTVRSL